MLDRFYLFTFPRELFVAMLLGCLAWSCRKDTSLFEPHSPSAEAIYEFLRQPSDTAQEYVVLLNNFDRDTILETPGGLRLWIEDIGALLTDNQGQLINPSSCGELSVRVLYVENNGGAITKGLSSVDETGSLLDLHGVMQIEFYCQSKGRLMLAPDRTLKIQIPSNSQLSNGLRLYSASQINDKPKIIDSYWIAQPDTLYWANWQVNAGQVNAGYELYTHKLGYIAWGRPYLSNNLSMSGSVCVALPTGHNETNTLVFIVFRQRIGAAALKDTGGKAGGLFCAKNVPVGHPIRAVGLSKIGDDWLMGWIDTETAQETSIKIALAENTPAQILEFLKTL
ncbi:MAG: hypothetical protein ACK4NS_09875 [Saprospiraceae bacterium]